MSRDSFTAASLVIVVLAVGCSRAEVPKTPPSLPNQLADLEKHDPTPDSLRSNPPPEGWMLGCFRLQGSPETEHWGFPRFFELTAVPQQDESVQTSYNVRALGSFSDPAFSFWKPRLDGGLTLSFSTGFVAVENILEKQGDGLIGVSRMFYDAGGWSEEESPVRLLRVECP